MQPAARLHHREQFAPSQAAPFNQPFRHLRPSQQSATSDIGDLRHRRPSFPSKRDDRTERPSGTWNRPVSSDDRLDPFESGEVFALGLVHVASFSPIRQASRVGPAMFLSGPGPRGSRARPNTVHRRGGKIIRIVRSQLTFGEEGVVGVPLKSYSLWE